MGMIETWARLEVEGVEETCGDATGGGDNVEVADRGTFASKWWRVRVDYNPNTSRGVGLAAWLSTLMLTEGLKRRGNGENSLRGPLAWISVATNDHAGVNLRVERKCSKAWRDQRNHVEGKHLIRGTKFNNVTGEGAP